MATVVWVRVKPNDKLDTRDSGLLDQRTVARFTQVGNWANTAVNFVIGTLLGVAINGLIQLVFTGAWVAVLNLSVLAVTLFCILLLHDWLGNKLFPGGIRPAREPEKGSRTPLARRLGLPVGLVVGVLLAALGLDDWVFGWLS
jgi:hypothetical protein